MDSGDLKLIASINSAAFGLFIKTLKNVVRMKTYNGTFIEVKDGLIAMPLTSGYLSWDSSAEIGKINLSITHVKDTIANLALLKGGNTVKIFEQPASQNIIYAVYDDNGPLMVITNKQRDEDIAGSGLTETSLKKENLIINAEKLDAEVARNVMQAQKIMRTDEFGITIGTYKDGTRKLTKISTGTYERILEQDEDDLVSSVDLLAFGLFPLPKFDEFRTEIYQNNPDDENDLWIKTICTDGMATLEYIEKLTELNEFDSFEL